MQLRKEQFGLLPADLQESNERMFARQHVDGYLDQAIRDEPTSEAMVHKGVALLEDWLAGTYYEAKNKRLAQLDPLVLEQLVRDVFVSVCYCYIPMLFVSVSAQMAMRMGFDDHRDSVLTMSEIMAVLCETNAFDINKDSPDASLMIVNKLPIPDLIVEVINRVQYLPPMVCKPEDLEGNFESPHLTFNDSLILGKGNAHTADICLDVINKQNQIPLSLSVPFLGTVAEEPTHDLDSLEKLEQWNVFKDQSEDTYKLMVAQGNRFFLTNKNDKRGRMYAQGYHITTQGTPFKKAMIEFADKQLIEGVPA